MFYARDCLEAGYVGRDDDVSHYADSVESDDYNTTNAEGNAYNDHNDRRSRHSAESVGE